jgi:hypothetical protein
MTCRTILERLNREFDSRSCSKHFSCKNHELKRRDRALGSRGEFLATYPFVSRPDTIRQLSRTSVYNPGAGNDYFFKWVVWTLKALGDPGLKGTDPLEEASRHVRAFQELLEVVANPRTTIGEKVDAEWGRITGLGGGDRVVVKKIVETYFPDMVMPIFRQSDMEHFVEYLGRTAEIDKLANDRYDSMSVGQKFELVSQILLASKKHLAALEKEDNYYFMYVLYSGSSRPPGMGTWRAHMTATAGEADASSTPVGVSVARAQPVSSVAAPSAIDDQYELETGIKKGQPYHNSKAARKAIELRAMQLAIDHYTKQGWSVNSDVSRNHPYDLQCTRGKEELRVEVKGKANGWNVTITRNEMRNAREFPSVALFIVSGIEVRESDGRPAAYGGRHKEWNPWSIDAGEIECFQYEYSPPA